MSVTKTLRKKFYSFEQEEQWLNELADLGWRLIKFDDGVTDFAYTFELDPTVKGMHYKIDYRMLKNKEEYEDYVTLFEEAGWQLVPIKWNNNKFIFLSAEAKDIYSDGTSLIERERMRRKTYLIVFIVFLVGNFGLGILYYFTKYEALLFSLVGYSFALVYLGWHILIRTKKMKQLGG